MHIFMLEAAIPHRSWSITPRLIHLVEKGLVERDTILVPVGNRTIQLLHHRVPLELADRAALREQAFKIAVEQIEEERAMTIDLGDGITATSVEDGGLLLSALLLTRLAFDKLVDVEKRRKKHKVKVRKVK